MVMFLGRRKKQVNRQQSLAAKPVRMVEAELIEDGKGSAKIKVPLKQNRWNGWMFRMPAGATKTFELDAIGLLVWNSIDGKTSVQQIIRKLSKRYKLNLREAEVPTVQFLQMLAKKGLIGMPIEEKKQEK